MMSLRGMCSYHTIPLLQTQLCAVVYNLCMYIVVCLFIHVLYKSFPRMILRGSAAPHHCCILPGNIVIASDARVVMVSWGPHEPMLPSEGVVCFWSGLDIWLRSEFI